MSSQPFAVSSARIFGTSTPRSASRSRTSRNGQRAALVGGVWTSSGLAAAGDEHRDGALVVSRTTRKYFRVDAPPGMGRGVQLGVEDLLDQLLEREEVDDARRWDGCLRRDGRATLSFRLSFLSERRHTHGVDVAERPLRSGRRGVSEP